jgi:RimJ/RimL family protein N-acetyltransferase
VQATLPAGGPAAGPAKVAWVVVRPAQGRGYATEAARSLVALLHEAEWTVVAHIHPGHLASQRVARGAGLSPTAEVRDGETRLGQPAGWGTITSDPCARICRGHGRVRPSDLTSATVSP